MKTLSATFALLLLVACSGEDGSTSDTGGTQDTGSDTGTDTGGDTGTEVEMESLEFATYNMGLAVGYVPYAEARLEVTTAAAAAIEADVLCIQEVWTEEHVEYVSTQLASSFPHIHYEYVQEEITGEAPCTVEEGLPLQECAIENCAEATDLATCVLENCAGEFFGTSESCQGCLGANIGLNDLDAIVVACTQAAATTTYGGHQGLMLASKHPIENESYTELDGFIVARGMLYAEIQGVQIVCTHLSSRLSATYGGDHESYEGENLYQMDTVRSLLNEKDPNKPQVIIGDFNAGPALGTDIVAELEANYQSLEADGYVCANTASETPFCTWCADNLLINDAVDNAIDHVMVRYAETSNPRRLLDTPITLETEDAPDGSAEVNLSDHFGLQVTVSWPKD